jgi:hypothetical protein
MDDAASNAAEATAAFDRLDLSARAAGRSMQAAFAAASAEGVKLEEVLRSVGQRLGDMALQAGGQAASNLLGGGLSSALTGLASVSGGIASADVAAPSFGGAAAGASAARPVSVVMNVNTPDAESFKRSEAQLSASLARAVARGGRAM